jgi:hypothetical protein
LQALMQEVLQSRAAPFLQSLHLIMSLACMLQGNAQLLWTSALHLSQLQVAHSPLTQLLGQQEETVLVSLLVLHVETVNVLIDCVGVDPTIYVQGRGT